MNILTLVGGLAIAVGTAGLVYGGITLRSRKDVVDLGSVHLQVDQKRRIPLSPIAGTVAVMIGVGLILVVQRRSARAAR